MKSEKEIREKIDELSNKKLEAYNNNELASIHIIHDKITLLMWVLE